jgi:hypothetical protein
MTFEADSEGVREDETLACRRSTTHPKRHQSWQLRSPNPPASRIAKRLLTPDVSERNAWWAHQDLNLEPTDYESAALTN